MYRLITALGLCGLTGVALAHGEHQHLIGLGSWLVHTLAGLENITGALLVGTVVGIAAVRRR